MTFKLLPVNLSKDVIIKVSHAIFEGHALFMERILDILKWDLSRIVSFTFRLQNTAKCSVLC